ncbi:hypothetical protein AB0G04_36170 [Actinoplanes sp. NPDC023801]|uniref:hypothetical protein n=1 Tax=Actinoplanes sp. NPDC023801 TaxID=3154595 RepID=UPI003410A179
MNLRKQRHTNGPLLDRISDLRNTVIIADAMHCQRDHVSHLTEHGSHWIPTSRVRLTGCKRDNSN